MIPKKVGSKSERRERVYKRAAETRRDFFRRGGARQAGGCHALPRGTELSGICDDEFDGRALHGLKFTLCICSVNFMFSRRPTKNHPPTFSTAERPVRFCKIFYIFFYVIIAVYCAQ